MNETYQPKSGHPRRDHPLRPEPAGLGGIHGEVHLAARHLSKVAAVDLVAGQRNPEVDTINDDNCCKKLDLFISTIKYFQLKKMAYLFEAIIIKLKVNLIP